MTRNLHEALQRGRRRHSGGDSVFQGLRRSAEGRSRGSGHLRSRCVEERSVAKLCGEQVSMWVQRANLTAFTQEKGLRDGFGVHVGQGRQ